MASKSSIQCVRGSSSLMQGLREHLLKMIASSEDRALRLIMRRNSFLWASRIKMELTRQTGARIFVCMIQKCLMATGYRSIQADRLLRLTLDHRLCISQDKPSIYCMRVVVCGVSFKHWKVRNDPDRNHGLRCKTANERHKHQIIIDFVHMNIVCYTHHASYTHTHLCNNCK